jgi:hypothetical protein
MFAVHGSSLFSCLSGICDDAICDIGLVFSGPFEGFPVWITSLYLLGLSFQPEEAPGFLEFYSSFVLVCSWSLILSPLCPLPLSPLDLVSNMVWFLA